MCLADCKFANARTVKEACTYAFTVVKAVRMLSKSSTVVFALIRKIKEDLMKARIPKISGNDRKRLLSEVEIEVKKAWEKVEEEKTIDITRRVLKTIIYKLNTEYGYGIKRITRLFNSFTKMLEESSKDEVYWEHIDRVVVDKLGLPFERDYTNNGQVISESRLKLKED